MTNPGEAGDGTRVAAIQRELVVRQPETLGNVRLARENVLARASTTACSTSASDNP
jgi:hypothetical protein